MTVRSWSFTFYRVSVPYQYLRSQIPQRKFFFEVHQPPPNLYLLEQFRVPQRASELFLEDHSAAWRCFLHAPNQVQGRDPYREGSRAYREGKVNHLLSYSKRPQAPAAYSNHPQVHSENQYDISY